MFHNRGFYDERIPKKAVAAKKEQISLSLPFYC